MDRIDALLVPFRRKLERFPGRHFVRKPKGGLKNSPLATLPIEILQQIATYLAIVSAASFSLTCRQMYFVLGTQYLEYTVSCPYKIRQFLEVLEHDLQNHIFCNPCRKLHSMKKASKYTEHHNPYYVTSEAAYSSCLLEDWKSELATYIRKRPFFPSILFFNLGVLSPHFIFMTLNI